MQILLTLERPASSVTPNCRVRSQRTAHDGAQRGGGECSRGQDVYPSDCVLVRSLELIGLDERCRRDDADQSCASTDVR